MKNKKLTHYQQLQIIEGLALLYEDTKQTIADAESIIHTIYRISHLNGTCENEHLDWHKEGFKWIKELKKIGITNIK